MLSAGCTLPPTMSPPPNYKICFINETGFRVAILEDNILVQECLPANQQQLLAKYIDDRMSIELGYRIIAYDLASNNRKDIMATGNMIVRVRSRYNDVTTRMFVIRYSGGDKLQVKEER